MAFRRSSHFCDSTTVARQGILGDGGNWNARHDIGYYSSGFGVANTNYHCTDFSVKEDWSQGENTFNFTFPHEGPWLIRSVTKGIFAHGGSVEEIWFTF